MRRLYLLVLFVVISYIGIAQSGKIVGKVINAASGQGLANATIILIEKPNTQVADQDGNFVFGKLTPGSYSVRCSYTGFQEKIVDEIVVKNNEVTVIAISLDLRKALDTVILKSTPRSRAVGETVASLLAVQKNHPGVMDGITSQQIRLTPDKGASDVIKRISGASIQDDRFAIIRGLNDRYNAAFINGAPLPSTESDRKAFAFDIFPAAILDNMIIYKTATPDKTGEFAGGIIDITTKSIFPKNFLSISFGGSYNATATGNMRRYSENKGTKDWLGIDDGTRAMPAGIPSAKEISQVISYAQKAELAKLFGDYKWGIQKGNTGPNYNFQLSKGFNIEKNQKEFIGALFSVYYNRNYTFSEGNKNSYDPPSYLTVPDDTSRMPIQRANYKDSIYNDEVIWSALGNIGIKIDNRNSISWKNNLSTNTDNRIIKRIGYPDFDGDPSTKVAEIVRWFTSNQIFSSQLDGEHLVGARKTKLNWMGSYGKVDREIPNLSRSGGSIVSPPSQTTGSGTMFFSSSNENIKNIKADITQPYIFMKNPQNYLKIGGGYQIRKRDFTSRVLGFGQYNDPTNGVSFDNSLLALPEDQIFLRQHLGLLKTGIGGFLLNDGTLPNSDYAASSALTHFYVMSDQRFFENFRLVYGLRVESFNQKLDAIKNLHDTVNINTTTTDLLPSVNFVYSVTSKMNARLSYSKTVNRPEFRELAPFIFFDYQTSFVMEGNPDMQRAVINNYDFRYEFFPGRAQLFSISAFYKDFYKPIELVSLPNTSSQTRYQNAKSAKAYGIEAEFRTLVSTLIGKKDDNGLLSKFTLSANAAYIRSNVKLDSIGLITADKLATDRALQGQSPYIINSSINFGDEKIGLSSTISVNRVGDRIFVAGTYNTSDIYEKARTVLDFQVAKFFLQNSLELKFTAKDFLGQNIKFYFDYDKSASFTPKDRYFGNYTPTTRVFSFSVTFKF